jgi:hypothetical protein
MGLFLSRFPVECSGQKHLPSSPEKQWIFEVEKVTAFALQAVFRRLYE